MRFFIFLSLLFISVSGRSEVSVEYELDPYYSNVGVYVPLTDADIEEVTLKNEKQIYLKLLKDIFTPRFFLAEASVNPLPVLGTWLKKDHQNLYEDAQVSTDLNLIEALTEGFEEPYAASFFLGNVIRFKLRNEEAQTAINKGYSGFVISVGDQHIKQNTLIDDQWYEIEWKLKGDRRIGPIYHSWSFRVGVKMHRNPEIADVSYFGIRRELFNRELTGYKFMQNTGIDLRFNFSRNNSNLVQSDLFVEKRWPRKEGIFIFGIGLKQTDAKYSGSLADTNSETRLILRPSFKF